jgi:hypothetical protein
MDVHLPNVKLELSLSGGWIAFFLWACVFTVAMGWSPVAVARYSHRNMLVLILNTLTVSKEIKDSH